ncbi:hypothetical protein HPB47_003729 [Ixodes persulcatus]|uniref:Uncharacterized protein n=1 Tax=Ixodes persulcatus TaxID=34615 RepID=A0AC60PHN9_IXOPE|nr:hypothetical protein HPB47_003729 [Ixodes persulcatus]
MSLDNHTRAMERFIETVRLHPFLYDKKHPEFKEKGAKLNRWVIIGENFGLNGEAAAAKFKNARDRWLKIASGVKNLSSGSSGNGEKKKNKGILFDVINDVLKNTPHYADRDTEQPFKSSSTAASPDLVERPSMFQDTSFKAEALPGISKEFNAGGVTMREHANVMASHGPLMWRHAQRDQHDHHFWANLAGAVTAGTVLFSTTDWGRLAFLRQTSKRDM